VSQTLPYVLFLFCPVSMRLMMRGTQGGPQCDARDVNPPVADLEREMEALRADRRGRVPMEL